MYSLWVETGCGGRLRPASLRQDTRERIHEPKYRFPDKADERNHSPQQYIVSSSPSYVFPLKGAGGVQRGLFFRGEPNLDDERPPKLANGRKQRKVCLVGAAGRGKGRGRVGALSPPLSLPAPIPPASITVVFGRVVFCVPSGREVVCSFL